MLGRALVAKGSEVCTRNTEREGNAAVLQLSVPIQLPILCCVSFLFVFLLPL